LIVEKIELRRSVGHSFKKPFVIESLLCRNIVGIWDYMNHNNAVGRTSTLVFEIVPPDA
jgi:hypothetical protein